MGDKLDRRRVLVGIAALMGGALSPIAAKAVEAATAVDGAGGGYKSLNATQVAMLRAVADTILPASDTPSATDVGVDLFIDHMLTAVFNEAEKAAVPGFLDAFAKKHPRFPSLPANQQVAALTEVDERLWEDTEFSANYRKVKELTLIGYYTSEIGATEELEYDPVPGPFEVVPVADYPRTWST